MATKLFLKALATTNQYPDWHSGNNDNNLVGTAIGWQNMWLCPDKEYVGDFGSTGVQLSVNTAAGPASLEFLNAGVPLAWVSLPVDQDVAISGSSTITYNLWGLESSMTANAGFGVAIEQIDGATGAITSRAVSTKNVELGTAAAVNNWTGFPSGSFTLKRGDRIRVRPYITDTGGTMAATFSGSVYLDGTTAGSQGDSWIQFTENIPFVAKGNENSPNIWDLSKGAASGNDGIAATTGIQQVGWPFVAKGNLNQFDMWLFKTGSPTDNLIIEVQTDSAGAPSGTVVGTIATVAGTGLTTTSAQYTYSSLGITLTPGTTYWMVFRRSGSVDAANFPVIDEWTSGYNSPLSRVVYNGSTWGSPTNKQPRCIFTFSTTTVYPTTTAASDSINPGSANELEAWTTQGSSSTDAITNTAAGWLTPIQITNTGGGTALEWYTRPLLAFTLGGMVVFQLRALASVGNTNGSLKCEVAVVNQDGTSPTVWGVADIGPRGNNSPPAAISVTERTEYAYVSGDDLAVTQGQRLRFRVFIDDGSANPMSSGQTITVRYNQSGSPVSTFNLPVAVTEYVSVSASSDVLPGFMQRRQVSRRAHLIRRA